MDWTNVIFEELPIALLEEFKVLYIIAVFARISRCKRSYTLTSVMRSWCYTQEMQNPTPEMFGVFPELPEILTLKHRWYGGETKALEQLNDRLDYERDAFVSGFYLPNQVNPDLLSPPSSLSAALRYGCLSIRKYRPRNTCSVPRLSVAVTATTTTGGAPSITSPRRHTTGFQVLLGAVGTVHAELRR